MELMGFMEELQQRVATLSDIHLNVGQRPSIREDGSIIPLRDMPLTNYEFSEFCNYIGQEISEWGDVIQEFSVPRFNGYRFRGSIYTTATGPALSLRKINNEIKTLKELGLPESLAEFCDRKNGLMLIVGQASQGRSTTLASMLEHINQKYPYHIITIEDPIEYLLIPKISIISQREVKIEGFAEFLRSALRQDPDVIMVGEIRDRETARTALEASETGHLVLSTLHAFSAEQAIGRILNMFSEQEKTEITNLLADTLLLVIAQRLIPSTKCKGMTLAYEIMINNAKITNLIRHKRTHLIPSTIDTSSEDGMVLLNKSLMDLSKRGLIAREDILRYSYNHDQAKQFLER